MSIVTGITRSGFCFEVNKNIGDNMELLEALSDMSDSDLLAMSRVCKIVFGEKQKKALYDHLRTEDGRVPIESVNDALKDVFEAVGKAGKNS